jgi:polysaccharide chain length determinant protein (PEP-CTERM system associated)
MVQNGEIGWTEAKRTLRRYWWVLPSSTLLIGALALTAAYLLPKRFTSQTMVLVEQPTVDPTIVQPVVTEDLNHRLAAMKEQILSRTRLQPIVEKFGLYAEDRPRVHIEDLVERLRTAVDIKPLEPTPGTQSRQLPGFYVNVTFDNPHTAQQICTEITSMFLEQNERERIQGANDTNRFLSEQLDEAKKNLAEQDAKQAQFKRQYLGSLPEEEQSNLNILTTMNSQLEANMQALSRAQQDKAFNESLLSQQEATWKASQSGQKNPETTEQQLNDLEDQLTTLQARYTDEHPDVIKLKSQLEELKKRMAEAPKNKTPENDAAQTTAVEPPQIQQLRAKLRQDQISIADLTRRQGQIQEEIRQLQARVQASPVVEQQLKELTRNYQTAQDFYNELLKKRQSAGVAGDLVKQQQSEQFRVYDPPSLPDKPSFPKKSYFAGGGLGGGFALGLAILYLIAMTDKSMYTERDVEIALKLPVLGLLPTMDVAVRNAQTAARGTVGKYDTLIPRI